VAEKLILTWSKASNDSYIDEIFVCNISSNYAGYLADCSALVPFFGKANLANSACYPTNSC